MSRDRRDIVGLVSPHFPKIDWPTLSSDDVAAFLDAQTGLTTDPLVENSSAFDAWRMALASKDVPVWPYTAADIAAMKARGEALKKRMAEMTAGQKVTVADGAIVSIRTAR